MKLIKPPSIILIFLSATCLLLSACKDDQDPGPEAPYYNSLAMNIIPDTTFSGKPLGTAIDDEGNAYYLLHYGNTNSGSAPSTKLSIDGQSFTLPTTTNANEITDIRVLKLSPSGALMWTSENVAFDATLHISNNKLYVADRGKVFELSKSDGSMSQHGYHATSAKPIDFFVLEDAVISLTNDYINKYNSDGSEAWRLIFEDHERMIDVEVDLSTGNIYFTGIYEDNRHGITILKNGEEIGTVGAGNSNAYPFLAKVTSDGGFVGGFAISQVDNVTKVVVKSLGNDAFYLVSSSEAYTNSMGSQQLKGDISLRKYSDIEEMDWEVIYNSSEASPSDRTKHADITLDHQGGVYLVGASTTNEFRPGNFIFRFDGEGNKIWEQYVGLEDKSRPTDGVRPLVINAIASNSSEGKLSIAAHYSTAAGATIAPEVYLSINGEKQYITDRSGNKPFMATFNKD